jgi:hypothetical protein
MGWPHSSAPSSRSGQDTWTCTVFTPAVRSQFAPKPLPPCNTPSFLTLVRYILVRQKWGPTKTFCS